MTSKSPSSSPSPPPSTTVGATSAGPNTAFPPFSYDHIPTGSSSTDLFPSSQSSIADSLQSFSNSFAFDFAFDDPDWDWVPDNQNLEPYIENYIHLSPFEDIEDTNWECEPNDQIQQQQDSTGTQSIPSTENIQQPESENRGKMVETGPPVQNSDDLNSGNLELKTDDGFKWKKYTHKKVSSGHTRIHYKCQVPLCLIKKMVETSSDGYITRIIYRGEHNHTKPRSTIRSPSSSSASDQQLNVFQGPSSGSGQVVTQENPILVSGDDFDPFSVTAYESQSNKRRKIENEQNYVNDIISIQIESDIDILDDGYKWKKYCTKYVKGNPNPRIYFRCTSPDCPVKKRVERAPNDIKSVITTYERKHNHPVPVAGSGRSSSQPANSPN